ncbi:MAG: sigma-70 family RNA polymerase sigma factor [Acidimicrobiales bacterium]|nr:sigma-70 family RNA polymerase sigma factor [Acidimicrobiales bacterium]HBL08636.1 RNA polymerase subunit sigma-70 [Acidimicrobiaceae bacterium]HIM84383.1 sigma-70 family RNA polymerase sigma factor [Acidimicrobiia bacterium]
MAKERIERDEEDLVRLYLTDIGQYPLLTKEGEVRLAQQIEKGVEARSELDVSGDKVAPARRRELRRSVRRGDEAVRTFVQSNLRLVVSIAKKYQASGLPLLDLIQEGNLGLMHAVEKFDWRKGFKFSTYATWWIRQAITRGIANTGRTIRLPVHAGDTLARLQKARSRLELKFGRPATLAELAVEVEMSEEKVTEALRFAAEPLSLSEPLREDGDAELGDVVEDRAAESPFEVAATSLLPEEISRLLAPLDSREREILKLRFGLDRGEPRTLEEVGDHFELTRERIRQIEARAMSKLRHPSSDTGARDLLAV